VIEKENLQLFFKSLVPNLNLKKINFNSQNIFSTKLNHKLKFSNFDVKSKIELEELLISNNLQLDKFLPKVKKNIKLLNHNLEINYKKDELTINGNGSVILQDNVDELSYLIVKKGDAYKFKSNLKIKENPFEISFIDYKKIKKNNATINIEGSRKQNLTSFNVLSFKEEKNIFKINNLILDDKFKIKDFKKVEINYLDQKDISNKYSVIKKKRCLSIIRVHF